MGCFVYLPAGARPAGSLAAALVVALTVCRSLPAAADSWFQDTPRYVGLATAPDGALYAAGTFTGMQYTLGDVSLGNYDPSGKTTDAIVVKYNETGRVQWVRQMGGAGADALVDIATDAAGNAYALGAVAGSWTTPPLAPQGTSDAVLLKIDAAGNIVWARQFGGPGAAMTAKAVAADKAGNILVSGTFTAADVAAPAMIRRGMVDAFVIKVDPAGNVVWARNFGGGGTTMTAGGLAADSGGNAYLTGWFSGNNPSFPAIPPDAGSSFAMKVTAAGDIGWARTTQSTGQSFGAYAIGVDGDDNIHVAGAAGAGAFVPSKLWLWKLTPDGDTTQLNSHGDPATFNMTPIRVAAEQDGSLYVGATYNGRFVAPSGPLDSWGGYAFSYDSLVLKFDAAGTLTYGLNYGSSSEDREPASTTLMGLATDSRGSYYFSAYASGWGRRPMLASRSTSYLAKYPATAAADTPSPVPQTGWWYNPAQTGRGLAIEYYPASGKIFLGVFGYGPGGAATWQVGVCSYDVAARTCSGKLDTYENGATLTELTHATATPTAGAGPFTLSFADSRNGTVTWTNEQFPITRFRPTTADGTDTTGNAVVHTGWYWDPAVAGRGYFLETWRNADGSVPLYGVGFMYRPDGTPTWYVAQGLARYVAVETHWSDLPFTEFAGGTPSFVGGNWTVPTQMQQVAAFPFSVRWHSGAAMLMTGTTWSWMKHFVQ